MDMTKQRTSQAALALAVTLVMGIWVVGSTYQSVRDPRIVSVTGGAEQDFKSNLVVRNASFRVHRATLSDTYTRIEREHTVAQEFLQRTGLRADGYTFESLEVPQDYNSGYNTYGDYQRVPNSCVLTQSMTATDKDLDGVESLSESISSLISQRVEITSQTPTHYYTNLDDLKRQTLRQTSEDALSRAREIASDGRGKVGKLQDASVGVFQVASKNTGEDYSWGGALNTSSRHKTASAIVRMTYALR